MPGLDHEVHELVFAKEGYGCRNRDDFKDGYFAQDRRYFPDGSFEAISVWVPYVMSTDCRFDMSLADKRCDTCARRGSGEAYNEMVRRLGT